MGKFIIDKRVNDEFQFILKADNGETILVSEGYSSKSSCENGIESVRENSKYDSRYICKKSIDGKFYFNLEAANGEIIGTSEMYESESGMSNGIMSVKQNSSSPIV